MFFAQLTSQILTTLDFLLKNLAQKPFSTCLIHGSVIDNENILKEEMNELIIL